VAAPAASSQILRPTGASSIAREYGSELNPRPQWFIIASVASARPATRPKDRPTHIDFQSKFQLLQRALEAGLGSPKLKTRLAPSRAKD
jgi:hypothetical protein